MLNFEVRLQALSLHFQKNEPADYDSYPDAFKSCIIGTMLNDEIGKICKVDKMILLYLVVDYSVGLEVNLTRLVK